MELRDFDFLADENIDPDVVSHMRNIGLNVMDVKEEQWQGYSDKQLLQIATDTQRVILTHDSDFGRIAFTEFLLQTGIIYIRPGHINATFHIATIQTLLATKLNLEFPFMLVAEHIAGKIKIRVRLL